MRAWTDYFYPSVVLQQGYFNPRTLEYNARDHDALTMHYMEERMNELSDFWPEFDWEAYAKTEDGQPRYQFSWKANLSETWKEDFEKEQAERARQLGE